MSALPTRTIRTIVILIAAWALAGCGGGSGGSSSSSSSSGPSEIAMSTDQLDFGNVAVQSLSDRAITVQNIGSGPLALLGSQPALPFSIFQSDCPSSLAPGAACTVYIRFSPTEQRAYQGSFTLTTNDSDEGLVTVGLLGTGKAYNVSINRIINDSCPLLRLLVTVTAGANGAPVVGLPQAAFSILENDAPVPISGFSSSTGLPVSVGLVLDYSSSTAPYTSAIETAAGLFVDNLVLPADEGELIKFDATVYQIIPYTTDKAALKSGIGAPFPGEPRQGTRLYDALLQSIGNTSARSNIRQAVIGVSDGNDFNSAATIDQVIAEANAQGVPIFMIGIGQVNSVNLQRLAEETGGQYFPYDPATSDFNVIYQTISSVLSEQYLIEYNTPSAGGAATPVLIDVRVNNAGAEGEDTRDATGC
jgi:VWFA-related protein